LAVGSRQLAKKVKRKVKSRAQSKKLAVGSRQLAKKSKKSKVKSKKFKGSKFSW
jgi:hypothetical protein